MKKLLLLLLCVPLIGLGQTENTEVEENPGHRLKSSVINLSKENIKGNVKQTIETNFNTKEDFVNRQKGNLSDKKQYDENGNMTEENSDRKWFGGVTKYQYEYDKLNNWTVKTTYKDDKLRTITEREIEYYE